MKLDFKFVHEGADFDAIEPFTPGVNKLAVANEL